jgi:S1-C subfamily serine protease
MMVNGKRVKTAAEIEEMINALKIGETIKLGVKRDRDMMIVSFAKPDPEEAGGRMMMVTKTVGDDGKVDTDVKLAGPDLENSVIVMEAGVILSTTENGLAVGVVIGNAQTDLDGDAPGDGDVIVSINGQAVSSNSDFSAVYDAIVPGETVAIVYLHDGVEKTVKFTKSAEKPMRMIHKG